MACLALDLKSAFDNVDALILQEDLKKLKIPLKIRKFIFNITTDRKIFCKVNKDLEGPFIRNKGVPQRDVLAEDTLFYNINKDIKKTVQNLQDNIPKILKYYEDRGLETNAEKTQLIVFTKKRIDNENYHIKI